MKSDSFRFFLKFYLVPSFGIYLSVASFCLIFCFYFYAFHWLVMFPNHGEVAFCRGCPVHLSSALPFGHQRYMFQGYTYMDWVGSFVIEECCGWYNMCGWSMNQLVARVWLVWRLSAGPGHGAPGHGTTGCPGAIAGPLVGRARFWSE